MPAQPGQCPNFGNCNTADSREVVFIQPGDEFRCPACNSTLRPVQSKGGLTLGPLLLRALGGAVVLAVLGAVCWGIFAPRHGHEAVTPTPTPSRLEDVIPAPSSPPPVSDTPSALLTTEAWNRLAALAKGSLVDEPISFPPGQTLISDDDQSTIRESLPKLDRFPRSRILVEAYVAPSDSLQEDQKLSDARALEVKRFLTQVCGLPPDRVFAKGCGSDHPPARAPGESEQQWKRRSRSVRILIVGE